MIFRIVFTKPASRDLDEIDDYLTAVAGPAIAERLVEEIIDAAETLQKLPMRQHERAGLGAGLRSIPVRNYLLFYRVEKDTVLIVRILHGSRDITSKLFPRSK